MRRSVSRNQKKNERHLQETHFKEWPPGGSHSCRSDAEGRPLLCFFEEEDRCLRIHLDLNEQGFKFYEYSAIDQEKCGSIHGNRIQRDHGYDVVKIVQTLNTKLKTLNKFYMTGTSPANHENSPPPPIPSPSREREGVKRLYGFEFGPSDI